MAQDLNMWTGIGRLTRDPELRFTQGGIPVCDFGIAVQDRPPKDGDPEDAHVNFFDVSAWRGLGELIANYKKQGDQVAIQGRLQFRQWEAQDGSKRSKVSITADNVQFLRNKGDSSANGDSSGAGSRQGGGQQRGQQRGQQQVRQGGNRQPVAPANQHYDESDFEDIPF